MGRREEGREGRRDSGCAGERGSILGSEAAALFWTGVRLAFGTKHGAGGCGCVRTAGKVADSAMDRSEGRPEPRTSMPSLFSQEGINETCHNRTDVRDSLPVEPGSSSSSDLPPCSTLATTTGQGGYLEGINEVGVGAVTVVWCSGRQAARAASSAQEQGRGRQCCSVLSQSKAGGIVGSTDQWP
eukprot:124435-Rhodomonas_salina.1